MQSQRFIISSCNQKENFSDLKKNHRMKKQFLTLKHQLLYFKAHPSFRN